MEKAKYLILGAGPSGLTLGRKLLDKGEKDFRVEFYSALDWDHMDKAGTVDGNYVNYSGFVYYNNTNGDFDQSFNGDTVNGTISTYYLNHDYADSTANQLDISNSVIHGSITSMLPGGYYDRFDADGNNLGGYDFYTDAVVDTHWRDGDVFTLNIANTTIDDDYEALYFTDS